MCFGKRGRRLRRLFFFDEIDSLVPARGSGLTSEGVAERMLSQFLTELDGIEELKGVLVLGATNRVDRLDPAVLRPGRFDEIIEIPPADISDREQILTVHLRARPLAPQIDLHQLAVRTEGYSGAAIASLCRRAGLNAVRRAVIRREAKIPAVAEVRLESEDFDLAFKENPDDDHDRE